jgi:hypothetical protein
MSHRPLADRAVTATSLLDEVMDTFQRGESALFADLARATWSPQATLASLTGSLSRDHQHSNDGRLA